MGKKGNSTVLKRLNTPGYWKFEKKAAKFTAKPRPGPHPARNCFTLQYVIRDLLKLTKTARETKRVLHNGMVKVDGKVRKDHRFPVGLMDVIEIPALGKFYRFVPDKLYNIKLIEITKDTDTKLCRIMNKTTIRKGHVQLNLHDGRNIVIPVKDPTNPKEDVYKVNDVLKIRLDTQEILEHVKLEENKLAVVVAGVNNGRFGKVVGITKRFGPRANTVTLDDQGNLFNTALDFVMVVGDDAPVIQMTE